MPRLPRVLVLALALAAAGCASSSRAGDYGGSRQADVITRDEVEAAGAGTAYDLVRSLRPMWLNTRPHSMQNPAGDVLKVYLNNTLLGSVDALRQIAAADVGSLRYYDVGRANYRFGQGHLNGAIQVIPEGRTDEPRP
ncbi:MAG TPA: hypothetical protein VHG51_03680 [Longimicrobiaceae bacterium]|nr:hypothetical protein [Longimicrobiaceae bacterium]